MEIDRLEERRAIAQRLNEAHAARKSVNKIPAVAEARAKSDSARKAADQAQREFSHVFNAHYPREDELTTALVAEHPDLLTLGGDNPKWIARCCVTGLPIFADDPVYQITDEEQTFVLAGAVTVHDNLVVPGSATSDEVD